MLVLSDVLMGFFDMVPVGMFFAASLILMKCYFNKMSKGCFACYATGLMMVSFAGFFKAIYKILLTLRVCNFDSLEKCLFPMQAIGFIVIGLSMAHVSLGTGRYRKRYFCSALPTVMLLSYAGSYEGVPVFSGTMLFVCLMCLGLLFYVAVLALAASKMKKPGIIVLLVISFIFSLGMGYLSTQDAMNDFIKEIVNTIGQGSMLWAAILLRKNGLGATDATVSMKKQME